MRNIDINNDGVLDTGEAHQGVLLDRFTINHPYNRMGRININTASFDILTRLPQMRVQEDGVQALAIINRRETVGPFNTIGEAVPYLTAVSAGGDDLDGDGFLGEDDELETIVRSISNLITTRSDRFEIVSTGSVWRGGEELAKSQMRVIVCRITPPALNAAGEIVASNVEILHFERR